MVALPSQLISILAKFVKNIFADKKFLQDLYFGEIETRIILIPYNIQTFLNRSFSMKVINRTPSFSPTVTYIISSSTERVIVG